MICVKVPDAEKDIWYRAKGNRTWKEYLETGLFGEHQPQDLISYAEAEALINSKLAEFESRISATNS